MAESTLEELDEATCLELLSRTPVGRIGFVHKGALQILPVNHAVDDGSVVFRTTSGAKLNTALRESGQEVVYEADGWDASTRTGWSVLIRGSIAVVSDEVERTRLDQLQMRAWADDRSRRAWIRVEATEISGRRIVVPADG
jgi:nitroimidazol reductase NimA-like FMN-containing flavoprotein (pyridoxamine 5'-phosphate oxidase superfamily)